MTIDALHGSVDRREPAGDTVAIGTPDANIFLCPRCTRPLAVGVSKCAGCGVRLVRGVPLLKASAFVGLGLLLGIGTSGALVGTTLVLSGPTTARVEEPPVTAVSSLAVPSALPASSAAPLPSVAAIGPTVPSAALAALQRSTAVNQRLLTDADLLERALAARAPSPADIAPLLRNLAATAAYGDGIAKTVGTWDDAASLSGALASFYSDIDRIAQDALAASVSNDRAYRDAGVRMLDVLGRLTRLDAEARALAATVDVDLAPLTAGAS